MHIGGRVSIASSCDDEDDERVLREAADIERVERKESGLDGAHGTLAIYFLGAVFSISSDRGVENEERGGFFHCGGG